MFAKIDELDGTPIVGEFQLNKVDVGKYTSTSQTMPAFSAIIVTYFIRKSSGSPETKYNPHYLTEVFLRDLTGELINDNLDAKISTSKVTEVSGSTAADTGLSASLEDDVVLIGAIEEDTIITGEVNEC